MDGYELNKIFGAVTGALMVFLTIMFGVEKIFGSGHHHHGEVELAYSVAAPDEEPAEAEEVVEATPLPVLLAAADASKGERVFRKCASCHNIEPGGSNGVGPALHGVMGRQIAGVDGFNYSDALAGKDGVWDWAAMDAFLADPKGWAPGTRMNFGGLKKEDERANLLVWMNAQSDAPLAAPDESAALDDGSASQVE